MDILSALQYFNHISLIFFFITLCFLVYELYLLKKHNTKSDKPSIPDFKDASYTLKPSTVLQQNEKQAKKSTLNLPVIIATVLLILFGVMSILGLVRWTSTPATNSTTEVIESVRSAGIKMYNPEFNELTKEDLDSLEGGERIIIGVEKTSAQDIDSARVRINTLDWNKAVVTTEYNSQHNVYFILHEVATGAGELNIQAQIHSKTEGWLGE